MDDRDVEWSDLAEIDKRWMDHGRRIKLLEAAVVGLVAPPEAAPERDAAAIESWEDGYKAGYKQASADKDSPPEAAPERATADAPVFDLPPLEQVRATWWRNRTAEQPLQPERATRPLGWQCDDEWVPVGLKTGVEWCPKCGSNRWAGSVVRPQSYISSSPSAVQELERTALFRPVASGSWIYGDRLIPGGCACTFSGGFEHFTWTPSAMCPIYGHVASSSPTATAQRGEGASECNVYTHRWVQLTVDNWPSQDLYQCSKCRVISVIRDASRFIGSIQPEEEPNE